jgi:putative flippase GtrA
MTDHDATVVAVAPADAPPGGGPRLLPHDMVKSVILRRGVRQFVKFGIVGGSGLLVNFLLFTLLQHFLPAANPAHDPRYSAKFSAAFLAGGVSNYFLNRIWTFKSSAHALKQGLQFIGISLVALVVALTVTKLLIPHLGPGHRTWFVATGCAIVVNFFANKYWTFKEP